MEFKKALRKLKLLEEKIAYHSFFYNIAAQISVTKICLLVSSYI